MHTKMCRACQLTTMIITVHPLCYRAKQWHGSSITQKMFFFVCFFKVYLPYQNIKYDRFILETNATEWTFCTLLTLWTILKYGGEEGWAKTDTYSGSCRSPFNNILLLPVSYMTRWTVNWPDQKDFCKSNRRDG